MPRPLNIVAADDEPDMVRFYQRGLAHLGHHARVAHGGRELVQLCRRERPDLVLTDLRMPDLGGEEAVREIWQDGLVPVVLVSADPADCHLDGPVLCQLRKPIRLADLARVLTLAGEPHEGGR
jgi:two-component system response regulator WspF